MKHKIQELEKDNEKLCLLLNVIGFYDGRSSIRRSSRSTIKAIQGKQKKMRSRNKTDIYYVLDIIDYIIVILCDIKYLIGSGG